MSASDEQGIQDTPTVPTMEHVASVRPVVYNYAYGMSFFVPVLFVVLGDGKLGVHYLLDLLRIPF